MSDRITMLMLKALRRLDPDEQDEVLESLLAARLGADAPPPLGVPGAATPLPEPLEADRTARVVRLFGVDPAGLTGVQGRLKVLPVRLPAADYDQLREVVATARIQHGGRDSDPARTIPGRATVAAVAEPRDRRSVTAGLELLRSGARMAAATSSSVARLCPLTNASQ